MVKYSAPPSSQIAMEDIVPTGWDEHYDDNFAFQEAREIPNNEGCFLSAYTPYQDAQVSIHHPDCMGRPYRASRSANRDISAWALVSSRVYPLSRRNTGSFSH